MKRTSSKIIAVGISAACSIGIVLGVLFFLMTIEAQRAQLKSLDTVLRASFDYNARTEVETAASMLAGIQRLREKGELSAQSAKHISVEVLRDLRYDKDGYFWADDSKGNNVVLLGSITEGTNRLEAKDQKGNRYMQSIIERGLAGGGYSDYWFGKHANGEALPKRSYSLAFKPYDWVIGTGNYIDDIDRAVAAESARLNTVLVAQLRWAGLSLLVVLAIVASFCALLGNRISRSLVQAIAHAKQVSAGDLNASMPTRLLESKDDVGDLSRALAGMTENLHETFTSLQTAGERQKQLIAELESRNEELARFTYTVSHDLKSPLITIKGFLGYLEKEAHEGNFDDFAKDLGRITTAADKMEALLLELLELSRIGRVENVREERPFGQIANEAVALVEGSLRERKVEVDIAEDMPIISGDCPRLREAIENLVDNAVKFMGEQEKPRIEIGSRTDAEGTVFYVRDNGIGVEPRYQKKIFGMFERLDPAIEGSGMGLAIVERIVSVHGGRIWVESEGLGKGSTFCFTLDDSRINKD